MSTKRTGYESTWPFTVNGLRYEINERHVTGWKIVLQAGGLLTGEPWILLAMDGDFDRQIVAHAVVDLEETNRFSLSVSSYGG